MRIVKAGEGNFIRLWRQGEDDVTRVEFDLTPYISEFGEGTAQLVVKRPGDSQGYVAPITRDGNTAVWVVGPEWLVAEGQGQCQLSWFVKGGGKAKSDTYKTHVQESIDESEEPVPEAQVGYLAQMQSIGVKVAETAEYVQATVDKVDAVSLHVDNTATEVDEQAKIAQNGARIATAKANESAAILEKMEALSNKGYVRVEMGAYVGADVCGSLENANTLKFDFEPKMIIVRRKYKSLPSKISNITEHMLIAINGEDYATSGRHFSELSKNYVISLVWEERGVSWFGATLDRQLNRSDTTYQYIAFG